LVRKYRPRHQSHCIRRGPSCPRKEHNPLFSPISIVATVAHLSYCRALVKHYLGLLDFNWYRAVTHCTHIAYVLTAKLRIKIVRKGIPTRRSVRGIPTIVGNLWPIGWMDQDATWQRGRPRPRPHCVRWGSSGDPAPTAAPSHSSAHIYCGQTVAHLSNC